MSRQIVIYRDSGKLEPYELKTATFELDKETGVAVMTWDVLKNYNALTNQLRMECFLVLEHINKCPDIRVVVWTAKGPAFSSGASLKGGRDIDLPKEVISEYAMRGMAPNNHSDTAFVSETRAFWDCKKPIIGAINNMAVGGAANMALCNYFDMVICSTTAKFKYPFVDIGLTAELGSTLVLPLIAGPFRAKQLIFTGEWFTAKNALEWGLVNEVVEPDQLLPRALEWAKKIAKKPTNQLMLNKRVLNHFLRKHLDDQLRFENENVHSSMHDFGGILGFMKKIQEQAEGKKKSSKL